MSPTRQVAVLDDYQHVAQRFADWSSLDADVTVFHDHLADPARLIERLKPFEVLVAMRERTAFPRPVLEALPNLKLLVTTGPFNAAIDVAAARSLGITVCGTGGKLFPTAELSWGLILACVKEIPRGDAAVRAGEWQVAVGGDLAGARLGVIGLGRLGGAVARVGKAFDMEVCAWSQNLEAARCEELGVEKVSKEDLLRSSDVVSIHLVLSERTRGLISAADLRAMKPSSYLVNTSRGPIVEEEALVKALREGWIAGAGLDVFDTEPLPGDHPLRTLPNVVLSPHMGYVTEETYRVFYGDAVEDIVAFYRGSPVRVLAPG